MLGAKEYANLFKTGQYGKLYITSGSHARGKTFHIQVLPKGEKAIPNGTANLCRNKNAVEVYGIVGGNPGWSEIYGWLHKGKWLEDFEQLVRQKISDIQEEKEGEKAHQAKKAKVEQQRIKTLLADF